MKGKVCTHCGKLGIPLLDFRWLKSNNGLASWCRRCESNLSTKYGLARMQVDPEYRERAQLRSKLSNRRHRERDREKLRRWREADWRRVGAHNAVALALRSGKLIKQPCMICGSDKSMAHHPDYDKPLEVQWLCQYHHANLHHGKLIA